MLNAMFQAYAESPLALKVDSWLEKFVRRTLWAIDALESAVSFQVHRLREAWRLTRKVDPETESPGSSPTLLAVYCLKANGLTFDFVTFLGIVEMERQRRGLLKSQIIVYAPLEFPIYQWQRQKVFNNMDGKPLIQADRGLVLGYVRKLADAARVFSATMQCEVLGERRDLLVRLSKYSQVFPGASRWTGNFRNMTEYKQYSMLKYGANGGRDAVAGYGQYRLGAWWSSRVGRGKLVATVNFRNQNYSNSRNANLEHWENFFSHPFIKRHFHFIVFNDAETPVTIGDTECITFCDQYVHDNFRRFKTILNVGFHIGNVSGSSSIVIVSDVPYLLLGEQIWEDWEECLNPERFSKDGDMLLYDRAKEYQLISFKRGPIMDDVRILLVAICQTENVLERYPASIRKNFAKVLRDWP